MSVISRSFTVNDEQIGQSTLWQLYSSGAAIAIIRLYTKDVNTDWLKDDIKKTYDLNLDESNGDGTFNLTWSYDITTFTKGYPVYVSYCFIVNDEVCAVGAGDTFDCYSITDDSNDIIEVSKTNNEEQEVSALYRQWYKMANLSTIVNNLDNVIEEFDKVIGLNRLKAIHLNDSINYLGAHKDRHAKIGEGGIGLEAIERIINHPKLKNLPFFLETPNDIDGYAREIALLKSLYKD